MGIIIKTDKEIEIMREGGKILADILKRLSESARPGNTTNDLEKLARELVLSHKVKSSFLGFDDYPAMLCTSINDEIVHGLPSDRKLEDGDPFELALESVYVRFENVDELNKSWLKYLE